MDLHKKLNGVIYMNYFNNLVVINIILKGLFHNEISIVIDSYNDLHWLDIHMKRAQKEPL